MAPYACLSQSEVRELGDKKQSSPSPHPNFVIFCLPFVVSPLEWNLYLRFFHRIRNTCRVFPYFLLVSVLLTDERRTELNRIGMKSSVSNFTSALSEISSSSSSG
jgi:hypothetical protein